MEIKKRLLWNEIKDYLMITLGLIVFTFGWAVFLLPYRIVTGGVTGIAAIVFYATKIPISYTYFFINVALLGTALKVLGLKFMMKTIYAIFALSFFLWLGQTLMTNPDGTMIQILGEGNRFMSVIIGCGFTGTAMAIVFLNNGSTGGTDIIAAVVNKYHNISLGRVILLIDILIVGSSLPIFWEESGNVEYGLRMMVFGFCTMAVETTVLDYVMNAQRESVQFLIFTKKYNSISQAIVKNTGHSVTLLDAHGWYTGKPTKVVCLLAKKRESVNIFRLIKMIDPRAFVSQSAVIGVYGEGFDKIKVKIKAHHLEKVKKQAQDTQTQLIAENNENSIRDKQQS